MLKFLIVATVSVGTPIFTLRVNNRRSGTNPLPRQSVGTIKYGIEEIHQQISVFLRTEQCLEYAIYLGVYAVFHSGFNSPDGTKWNPGFWVIVS